MGKPNFRIVEGETRNTNVDYEQLKLDYLNPELSVDELLEKHNISRGEYYRQRKIIVEETGVAMKPRVHCGKYAVLDVMRYITQDPLTHKFRVGKYVNGMLRHYGRYKTLEEAQRVRDVLIENDWDWEFYWKNIKPHYFRQFPEIDKDEVLDDFEKDYLQGMTGKELQRKYGVSRHHYNVLSTSIKHKYGLLRKPMKA